MKTKIELVKKKMKENEIRAAEILKMQAENPTKLFKKFAIIDCDGYKDDTICWLLDKRKGSNLYYVVRLCSIIHQKADSNVTGHESIWTKMFLETTDGKKASDMYYKMRSKGNSTPVDELENAEEIKKAYNDIIATKKKTKSVTKRVEILKSLGYIVYDDIWFNTKKCTIERFGFYRLGNLQHETETYTLDNGTLLIDNIYRSPYINLFNPHN